jgi:uncharacterized paraquat-inducible protein A
MRLHRKQVYPCARCNEPLMQEKEFLDQTNSFLQITCLLLVYLTCIYRLHRLHGIKWQGEDDSSGMLRRVVSLKLANVSDRSP